MLTTLIDILHVFVCGVLMFVVLLQQGKGGGMGAAFGGGGAAQVFGGRGAGNLLTRTTSVCAALFMLTSVSLAYLSSSGDRAIRARVALEAQKKAEKGIARPKDTAAATPSAVPSGAAAPANEAPAVPSSEPAVPAPAPSK
jgi:preprotein translocase subunit SecG